MKKILFTLAVVGLLFTANQVAAQVPVATITSPTSSSEWAAGSNKLITWEANGSNYTGNLTVYLFGYPDPFNSNTVASITNTPNDGNEWIQIPGTVSPGDYRVRICTATTQNPPIQCSVSPTFKIVSAPSITITAPAADDEWTVGVPYNVTWNSPGIPETVNTVFIGRYATNGQLKGSATGQLNDGEFEAVINATNIDGSSTINQDYYYRVAIGNPYNKFGQSGVFTVVDSGDDNGNDDDPAGNPTGWQNPQEDPPNCDPSEIGCYPPVNISNVSQYKPGLLTVGALTSLLGVKVGENYGKPDNLLLGVNGRVGATHYCDENGENCVMAGSTGSGITRLDQGEGIVLTPNPITTTGTISVDIGNLTNCGTAITGKVYWDGTKFVCADDQTGGDDSPDSGDNFGVIEVRAYAE